MRNSTFQVHFLFVFLRAGFKTCPFPTFLDYLGRCDLYLEFRRASEVKLSGSHSSPTTAGKNCWPHTNCKSLPRQSLGLIEPNHNGVLTAPDHVVGGRSAVDGFWTQKCIVIDTHFSHYFFLKCTRTNRRPVTISQLNQSLKGCQVNDQDQSKGWYNVQNPSQHSPPSERRLCDFSVNYRWDDLRRDM